MDSITDILARPEVAARQIEQLSAAVKALTEQLAAVTAERDAAAANFLHASKEWQTAGDEVARLRLELAQKA